MRAGHSRRPQRELFRIGQDAAVNTGNLSPLVAAGLCYLVLTVPITHLVNYIDKRLRTGRRVTTVASGLDELDELEEVILANTEQPPAAPDRPATSRSK